MNNKNSKMEKLYKEFVEPEEKKLLQALLIGLASKEEVISSKSKIIIQRDIIPAIRSNPFLEQSTIVESERTLKLLIEENRGPESEDELSILEHSIRDFYAKQITEGKFEGTNNSVNQKNKKGCLGLVFSISVVIVFLLFYASN